MRSAPIHDDSALPDIMMDDEAILAARAEGGLVPRQGADAGRMPLQGSDLLAAVRIPDLNDRAGSANGDVLAIGRPGDAGDILILLLALHQRGDAPAGCIPQIHTSLERDCHLHGSGSSSLMKNHAAMSWRVIRVPACHSLALRLPNRATCSELCQSELPLRHGSCNACHHSC